MSTVGSEEGTDVDDGTATEGRSATARDGSDDADDREGSMRGGVQEGAGDGPDEHDGDDESPEEAERLTVRDVLDTDRWVGAPAVTLLFAGLAIVVDRQAGLLLAGAVGVVFAAYAYGSGTPAPTLAVERRLSDETPGPGDDVRVTVTVRNEGEATLPDLRLVDGVPPALAVGEGSPRHATALRPGKRATFSYVVPAVRGRHEWESMQVIVRNAPGTREVDATVDSAEPTTLRCSPDLDATGDLPLRGLTTQYTGRIATDVGGPGLEFHSTRDYRHGDPLNRVDWNRMARTGELATLDFREERAATVVLLVDAREEAYVAPEPGAENAVERSVEAAGRSFSALLGGGDRVGLAALGPDELWLAPGAGNDHRARARDLLASHPALSPTPPDGRFFPSLRLRRLRRQLPSDAQLIVFSPLVDDYVASVARRLDAYGHLVTVVSPDPTAGGTPGELLARIERRSRISRLRRAGLRVVDWGDEPLATAVAGAAGRWSG
ncbi:DUF58 domain-containing protein [Halobium salinum]|uniref:DUF58 domain-containing protein n=1 Tax=Halobium salinum TaxID=1364940 RepID=A0ABD5PCX3_9EURY|nr:DUF58 domain-containing protein [Halobium salinum]